MVPSQPDHTGGTSIEGLFQIIAAELSRQSKEVSSVVKPARSADWKPAQLTRFLNRYLQQTGHNRANFTKALASKLGCETQVLDDLLDGKIPDASVNSRFLDDIAYALNYEPHLLREALDYTFSTLLQNESTQLVASQIIGSRYVILNYLGAGSMGQVYQAKDRFNDITVALKKIATPTYSSTTSQAEHKKLALSLSSEFRLLASLHHPAIISVIDYGFDANFQPYYTMDFLEKAESIIDYGQKHSLETQIGLLVQLLQGLAYLHRCGIIHRDLKPSNVMVVSGQVKVLDFGLSITQGQAHNLAGTPRYMAPEVLEGGRATTASDLYAVGVIACQLLTGRYPYEGSSNLIESILYEAPVIDRSIIDDQLADILQCLLARIPTERYRNAAEVIEALIDTTGLSIPEETISIRESFLQAAPFVGREAELERLSTSLTEAIHGNGSSWLLTGESGIGKSRLLNELIPSAMVEGALVFRGQCLSEKSTPFQEWRELVRRLALMVELTDAEASFLKLILPTIDDLLGRNIPALRDIDAAKIMSRLVRILAKVLQRTGQPVVIILEDLQWAGQESLQVLNYLSKNVSGTNTLIIGSYRDDDSPDLSDTLEHMHVMKLHRLTKPSVAKLCEVMLGKHELQHHLIDRLQQETEGNAFFLVEIIRDLAQEAGKLEAIGKNELPDRIFPRGIRQIVDNRLQHIPEVDRPLVEIAAVMGRIIDLPALKAVDPAIDLNQWLNTCVHAAIIRWDDRYWQFSHDKIREALVEEIPTTIRPVLHRKVALALETLSSNIQGYAATLAYHWRMAQEPQKECYYSEYAGIQAFRQFAYSDALTYVNRTLELLPADDLTSQFRLLRLRENIYDIQGLREAQFDNLNLLMQVAENLDSTTCRAEVKVRQARYAELTGDWTSAVAHADVAAQLARLIGAQSIEAESRLWWGRALSHTDYTAAHEQLEQARTLAYEAAITSLLADSLRNLGLVAWKQGEHGQARLYYEEALALYVEDRDRQGESFILNNIGLLANEQGNYTEAKLYLMQALIIFREIGDQWAESNALVNVGLVAHELGQYRESREHYERALQLKRQINEQFGELNVLACLGQLFHDMGEFAAALEYSYQAVILSRKRRQHRLLAYALTYLGHALTALECLRQATNAYQRAIRVRHKLGESRRAIDSIAGLARTMLAQNNVTEAMQYVESILSDLAHEATIDSIDEPGYVYLTCYKILSICDDMRAYTILEQAVTLLQRRAASITDETLRNSFLENVPAHRELLEAVGGG